MLYAVNTLWALLDPWATDGLQTETEEISH
jgi:hypothetical protein